MLKNIPSILSPELLKVLCEMGHSDRICIGDGNFPGAAMAKAKGAIFLRADGHGVPELLDAILSGGAESETASVMSYGFDPYLSECNPFYGAYNAVIESVAKLAAAGGATAH